MNEPQPSPPAQTKDSRGRFDNLVFVTCTAKLRDNIGRTETDEMIAFLRAIPRTRFVDLAVPKDATEAAKELRKSLSNDTRGVVIIGGYDVLPSLQLNILSDKMLNDIENDEASQGEEWDRDNFIVWSDDVYGDRDGDLLPEFPVSRIPDGKSAALVTNALKAPSFTIAEKYGLRNIKRPFAEDVFKGVPYKSDNLLEVSENCSPKTMNAKSMKGAIYFMLHGHSGDATRFTGELGSKNGYYEAFDIFNVPEICKGSVVFTGCCYGALVALPTADRMEAGLRVRARTTDQSIALAFLAAGVNGFVGCTAAHYSSRIKGQNFFGIPMHHSFWENIAEGMGPAEALFEAKKEYSLNMPHGLTKEIYKAVEVKMLHQFTCLGIGW